jgi:uncharacterized protein (TIGR00251 family)
MFARADACFGSRHDRLSQKLVTDLNPKGEIAGDRTLFIGRPLPLRTDFVMFTVENRDSPCRNMLINVRVTPNSKSVRVVKIDETTFEVKVDEKAVHGAANKRLLEILSKHLGVPKSRITIVRGARSRDKILNVVG